MEYIIESGKHALKSQQKQGRMVHMKNNAIKTAVALTLAVGTLATCACASAASTAATNSTESQAISAPITPFDMQVDSGTYSGTQFNQSYALTSRNGKYLNFWVKNNGSKSVTITIDGTNARTLAAGEQGHISKTLGILTQSHTCKAVSSTNGGTINIEFRIAQRDNQ